MSERAACDLSVYWREVNERISAVTRELGETTAEFMCECLQPACYERFETSVQEFVVAARSPGHFVLFPGHEEQGRERVLVNRTSFVVVERTTRGGG